MNEKLFLFGIGGTGARVTRSLLMLLACGVKLNAKAVIPIIIDPDVRNGDKVRTNQLLKAYHKIQQKLNNKDKEGFFSSKVATLYDLDDKQQGLSKDFNRKFLTSNKKFKDFIAYDDLSPTNQDFMQLLFSEENLENDLTVGFKGNPNVGSVVLNALIEDEDFGSFSQVFNQHDRIFLISSIFGGTGAAGFPLILKNLRNEDSDLDSNAFVNKAIIGAITVLPYFTLDSNIESAIDANNFITKTKTALAYYENGLDRLDALYYIGDKGRSSKFPNNPGQARQRNEAHVIEFISALAIYNFMSLSKEKFDGNEEYFYEYGLKKSPENDKLTFAHFPDKSIQLFGKPLLQFTYFCKIIKNINANTKSFQSQPWFKDMKVKEKQNDSFLRYVETAFINKFEDEWLIELSKNELSFAPLDIDELQQIDQNDTRLSYLIQDKPITKKGFWSQKPVIDFKLFHKIMNDDLKNNNNLYSKYDYDDLFKLIFRATDTIFEEKIQNVNIA